MDHVADVPGLATANRGANGVTQKWTLYAWPAMQLVVMDTRGLNDPDLSNEKALVEVLRGINDNQLEIGAALLCINGSFRRSEEVKNVYELVAGLHPLMAGRLHIWVKSTADCDVTDIEGWNFKGINGASKHPWRYTFNAVDVMSSLLKEPALQANWRIDRCSNCKFEGDRRLHDTGPCLWYVYGGHENTFVSVTQVTTSCHKGPFVEVNDERHVFMGLRLRVLNCQNCDHPKYAAPCDSNTTGGPVTLNPVSTSRHIGPCNHRGPWFQNWWTKGHYEGCGCNGGAGCHCDYSNQGTSASACEITTTGGRDRCTKCNAYDQTGSCPQNSFKMERATHEWVPL
ncbi:unnamed protein product [Rotaria magnacalcarata]|nr:unnamed protein product [Rotaria magnacalcarata]